jgi:hypothetical protein
MPDGEASHATVVADAAGNRSVLKWWQMAGAGCAAAATRRSAIS